MTWLKKVALATGFLGAGLAAALYMQSGGHKIPKERISDMKFPKGAHVTGDESGVVCHEVWLIQRSGRERLLSKHVITGHDFKNATDEQRKQWIIEETQRDVEAQGLACVDPAGNQFFRPAYAQRRCTDCGPDCTSWSCPATTHQNYCTLGGASCVITYLCCDSVCIPSC